MTNSTLYTAELPRVVTETVSMVETKSFTVRNTWFPYLKPLVSRLETLRTTSLPIHQIRQRNRSLHRPIISRSSPPYLGDGWGEG